MRPRPSRPLLLAALLVALGSVWPGGCAPANPLDVKVSAASGNDFAAWRSKMEPRLDAGQIADLELAVQEFRHSIAALAHEASDPATVEALVCNRIDGRSLRQLCVEGARLRILRLTPEHGAIRAAIEGNQQQLASADAPAAEALRARIARQTERLKKLSAEIEAAEARLRALDGSAAPPGDAPPLAAINNR